MWSYLIERLKSKRKTNGLKKGTILYFFPLMIIIILLVVPIPKVLGYSIIIENNVDADSDEDATANIGDDGATSYVNAQSKNDDDQIITEAQGAGYAAQENISDTFDSYSTDIDSYPDVGTDASWSNAQATDYDSAYMTMQEYDQGAGGGSVSISNSYSIDAAKRAISGTLANVVVASGECIYFVSATGTKNADDGKFATGVTFNGAEGFEKVGIGQFQNGEAVVEIWRLLSPTATTADVVVTWPDNQATWEGVKIGCYVLANVDISGTPDDGFQTASGAATPATIGVTTSADDFTIDVMSVRNSDGQTEAGDGAEMFNLATDNTGGGSSYFTATDAQSDHTWTLTTDGDWASAGVSINPVVGSTDYELDLEYSFTTPDDGNTYEYICFYIQTATQDNDQLIAYEWDGSWVLLGTLTANTWNNFTLTALDGAPADFYIRFIDSDQADEITQSTWNMDAIFLRTSNDVIDDYELQWEHQVNTPNPDPDKDRYLLCIYGFSSGGGSENFEIQMWDFGGTSWDTALTTEISTTEQWYNQSIPSSYIDTTNNEITWRYRGTNEASDTTQDTLNIDYAGIRGYNVSVYGLDDFNGLIFSPDNSEHSHLEFPLSFQVESGAGYDLQIKGIDTTGTPVTDGYIYWNTANDYGTATQLTTSFVNFLTGQSAGNNTHTVYLWVDVAWSAGDSGMPDGNQKYTINMTTNNV